MMINDGNEKRAVRSITETREYRMGYEAGYREGTTKSLESAHDIIHNSSNLKVIVTTEEYERLRKE